MKTDIKKAIFLNRDKYVEIVFKKDFNGDLLDFCANFLKKGFKIIQTTNIDIEDKLYLELLEKLRQLCSIYEALLIVKSRCDIAILASADGILLDDCDIAINYAKKLLNDNCLIGIKSDEEVSYADFVLLNTKIDTKIQSYIKIDKDKYYTIYKKANL